MNRRTISLASSLAIAAIVFGAARLEATVAVPASGSTKGVRTTEPRDSFGLQLGSEFAAAQAALSLQRVGVQGGAVNLSLGTWLGGFAVTADYLYMFDESMHQKTLGDTTSYNELRGALMPYCGFGASVGYGVAARAPFGIQYTMLRDPFTFFGGGALVIGSVRDRGTNHGRKTRVGFGLNFGARLLI